MFNIDLKKLIEASESPDSIFEGLVSIPQIAEARAKCEPLMNTREGQLKILNQARNGDESSAIFLYERYMPIIKKAFWKYYIGPNKQFSSKKLQNNDAAEFATTAFMMLISDDGTSPYRTFDPEKFSDSANLITQFAYYYYRYLQNEAFKLLRKNNKDKTIRWAKDRKDNEDKDLNIDAYDDSTSDISYDEYFQNNDEVATEDFSDTNNLAQIFKEFGEWLKANKNPKLYKLFMMRYQGESFADIAKALGYARGAGAREQFEKIKKWFKEQYPDLNM